MNEIAKTYTAFWPVFLVFLCFTITNILSLIGNLETRSNLTTDVNQLAVGYEKAQAKKTALSGLAHDLIELAPTSPVAQQIVTDFHIQLKNQTNQTNQARPGSIAPSPTHAAAGNNAPKP